MYDVQVRIKSSDACENKKEEDLTLLMRPVESEAEYITVSRQVVVKDTCEKTVLVSPQTAGLVNVFLHQNVSKNHDCMKAKGFMNVYARRHSYQIIDNFGKIDVNMPKQQEVGAVTNETQ